jgi:tetratricopeptide (TPR) repeat protein
LIGGVASLALATTANAQSLQQHEKLCWNDGDAQQIIASCTTVITTLGESRTNVEAAYMWRARAFAAENMSDKALADITQAINGTESDPLPPADGVISAEVVRSITLSDYYGTRAELEQRYDMREKSLEDYTKAIVIASIKTCRAAHHLDMTTGEFVDDQPKCSITTPVNELTSRAHAYEHWKLYDLAIADYNSVLIDDPAAESGCGRNALTRNDRAWVYHLMRRDSEGLADANCAVQIAPDDAAYVETRAEIFEKLGNTTAAIADYHTALKLKPGYAAARSGLARLGAQ